MTLKLTGVETFDRTEQSSTLHCTRQTWNTNLASRRLRTECTQRQERGLRRRERRSWTHSTTGLERNWRENCNRTIRATYLPRRYSKTISAFLSGGKTG